MPTIKLIQNKNKAFAEIKDLVEILQLGFTAVGMDYGYHIENTFGSKGKHKIYDLRDNVDYRLESSILHYEYLLRHLHKIEGEFIKNLEDGNFKGFFDKPPHIKRYEKELSAFVDSIIFHLSSIFDYLTLLIIYTCYHQKDKRFKWIQLNRSCNDKSNIFSEKKISTLITKCHNEYVAKLNEYRTDLIHYKSDLCSYLTTFKHENKPVKPIFKSAENLRKKFRKRIKSDDEFSIAYMADWLIKETIYISIELLLGIREEMESESKFHENIKKPGETFLVIFDPKTKTPKPLGTGYWEKLEEALMMKNDQ